MNARKALPVLALLALLLIWGCTAPAQPQQPVPKDGEMLDPFSIGEDGAVASNGTTGDAQTDTAPQNGNADGETAPSGTQEDESLQQVEKGDTVSVDYKGTFPDGEIFDQSEGRGPLTFVAGAGQMIKGFDDAVIGMKVGDEKNITLSPTEAYGESDPAKIVEVTIESLGLPAGFDLTEGLKVETNVGTATVTKVADGNATLDFNHPMAGKTLNFWLKVTDLQKSAQ